MQGGRFDHTAHLFTSIAGSWRMATTHMNDFRALIPGFFVILEFLVNADNFDLGEMNGSPVGNAVLPRWAATPVNFIYLHRRAMECDIVSAALPMWIDLMWGIKQTGDAAVASENTYDPHVYPEFTEATNLEPLERARIDDCG
jgi:hypothetical protein